MHLPVLIHPHFWRRRRVTIPGYESFEIPTTSRRALQEAGFEITEDRRPGFLFERSVLVTGEVPRNTGYEPGFPPQQAWLNGGWEPDPLVLDDQALIVDVAGKGPMVITGCGHAGVVNICPYARRLTGDRPLYAVIGGFHLNGPLTFRDAGHPTVGRRRPGGASSKEHGLIRGKVAPTPQMRRAWALAAAVGGGR